MASRKQHCRECKEKFGKDFDHVHKWLDGLCCKWEDEVQYLDLNHRRHRHHEEGLEKLREMFGDEAYEAGKLHLMTDFGRIPKEAEYKNTASKWMKWEEVFGTPTKG